MKLLILTQKINEQDPVLGFFVGWTRQFHQAFGPLNVICLEKGDASLPESVTVHSLGKERHPSRLLYIYNFFRLIFSLRHEYDTIFVHMNQEYVLLGALPWKLMGKKIVLWRNHPSGSALTNLAVYLSDTVLATSAYSYTAKFKKTQLMPVGIDTAVFTAHTAETRDPHSLLYVGRVAPLKKLEVLIAALGILKIQAVPFNLKIVGPEDPSNEAYSKELRELARRLHIDAEIEFVGPVAYEQLPQYFASHQVLINMSPNGMYDKVIFEAMASGCLALTSNKNLQGELPDSLFFAENNSESLSKKISELFFLDSDTFADIQKSMLRYVEERHSLVRLTAELQKVLGSR